MGTRIFYYQTIIISGTREMSGYRSQFVIEVISAIGQKPIP